MFSERVRALRNSKHLTQKQLAERVGVQKATVAGWEAGQYRPLRPTFALLCAEFGATEPQLTGDERLPILVDFQLHVDVPELRKTLEEAGAEIKNALSVLKKLQAGGRKS